MNQPGIARVAGSLEFLDKHQQKFKVRTRLTSSPSTTTWKAHFEALAQLHPLLKAFSVRLDGDGVIFFSEETSIENALVAIDKAIEGTNKQEAAVEQMRDAAAEKARKAERDKKQDLARVAAKFKER